MNYQINVVEMCHVSQTLETNLISTQKSENFIRERLPPLVKPPNYILVSSSQQWKGNENMVGYLILPQVP